MDTYEPRRTGRVAFVKARVGGSNPFVGSIIEIRFSTIVLFHGPLVALGSDAGSHQSFADVHGYSRRAGRRDCVA